MPSGWSNGRGGLEENKEDLCLYLPVPYWQKSARSSVGEHTCIQRGEREDRRWDGRRQRRRKEMTACQVFRLRKVWWQGHRDCIVRWNRLISLRSYVPRYLGLTVFMWKEDGILSLSASGWTECVLWLIGCLLRSLFNKISCLRHLRSLTE